MESTTSRFGKLGPNWVIGVLAVVGLLGGIAIATDFSPPPEEEGSTEANESAVEIVEPTVDDPPEPRVAPAWTQSPSPADFSRCELLDPRPDSVKELFRGQTRDGVIGRDNVGFPRTEREIPGLGEGNIIVARVAFEDAPPSDLVPDGYLEEQTELLTQWSEFWSQGKFRYTFQVVEDWVEVPARSADYPIDPGAPDNEYDQEEFQRVIGDRMETVTTMIVDALPRDLDFAAADAVFVYLSPEMTAFKQSLGVRGAQYNSPQGTFRFPVSAGGIYHYSDANGLAYEVKRENLWNWWAHELMHFQGMNGHAPGNGWKTGVGQGSYPINSGEYSGAITAWETFLFEWYDDDQVYCADLETLTEPQTVMLTPLEVYGGERTMAAIRTTDHKVLVVESRRPVGWSENWPKHRVGVLVYEVDADGTHTDHVPDDCGNDPEHPKWAYYLHPDSAESTVCIPNDIDGVMVKEGMSVTHSGVKISLEYSDEETDYVLIERVND